MCIENRAAKVTEKIFTGTKVGDFKEGVRIAS